MSLNKVGLRPKFIGRFITDWDNSGIFPLISELNTQVLHFQWRFTERWFVTLPRSYETVHSVVTG